MKKFAFDNRFFKFSDNIRLLPGKVEKKGVAIVAETPLDYHLISSFGSTVVRLDDGSLRFYYTTLRRDGAFAAAIAIAESTDGLNWVKPGLGQARGEGRASNRLILEGLPEGYDVFFPSVTRLSEHSWRMYCWVHGPERFRYVACDSADGTAWKVVDFERPAVYHHAQDKGYARDERVKTRNLQSNDNNLTYYDAERGLFVMYTVWLFDNYPESGAYSPLDNARGSYRVIQRRESRDGLDWSAPEIILCPNVADPPDTQFYYLAEQPMADWKVGALGYYRPAEQTMDMELIVSRDGERWDRPLQGRAFIKRETEQERGMVTASHRWVETEDKILFYYSAHKHSHNGKSADGEVSTAIALAEIGRDRVIAAAPGVGVAEAVTAPFVVSPRGVVVNFDIKGEARAELRDPFGKTYAGFSFNDGVPFSGDVAGRELTWGDRPAPRDKSVRLALRWNDGSFYALTI